MNKAIKFLLGAGVAAAAVVPFKIKNEDEPGEVEVQSLLYRVKYQRPAEEGEKGNVSFSLPGVADAEDLGEFVNSVRGGVEKLFSKVSSTEFTMDDLREKAEDLREKAEKAAGDVKAKIEDFAAQFDDSIEVEVIEDEDIEEVVEDIKEAAEEFVEASVPVDDNTADFADTDDAE